MPGNVRNAPSTAENTARNSLNAHLGAGPLWNKINDNIDYAARHCGTTNHYIDCVRFGAGLPWTIINH